MELPKTPAFRLEGKRALITGASSGIGLGCAAALAEYGAEVVVAARSGSDLACSFQALWTHSACWSVLLRHEESKNRFS